MKAASNALSLAAMRATLGKVMTDDAFELAICHELRQRGCRNGTLDAGDLRERRPGWRTS